MFRWKQWWPGNNFPVLRLDALMMALWQILWIANVPMLRCGLQYFLIIYCFINIFSHAFFLFFFSFSFYLSSPQKVAQAGPELRVYLSQCLSMISQTQHTCLDISLMFGAVSFYFQWYQMSEWKNDAKIVRGSIRAELTAIQFL